LHCDHRSASAFHSLLQEILIFNWVSRGSPPPSSTRTHTYIFIEYRNVATKRKESAMATRIPRDVLHPAFINEINRRQQRPEIENHLPTVPSDPRRDKTVEHEEDEIVIDLT
jgi:hypothetical protein